MSVYPRPADDEAPRHPAERLERMARTHADRARELLQDARTEHQRRVAAGVAMTANTLAFEADRARAGELTR